MLDDPEVEANVDAMLPELRRGLELAAERRVRRDYPFWGACRLLVLGAMVGGLSVWPISDIALMRSAGCAAAVLCCAGAVGMGLWWRREVRREMRQVLLDPHRCLKCGYRLAGLESRRCPECGEPFLSPPATPKL